MNLRGVNMMNLRGDENRNKFVKKYDLKPISHQKLLKGQTKDSVGGSDLTDRYYCFVYNKKGESQTYTFICGYHIAESLLEKTNQQKLPLFNPIKSCSNSNESNGAKTNGNNQNNKKWNEVAYQLSNAINLLISYRNKPIDRVLAKIHLKINKYYYKEPFDSEVKSVNTIIGKLLRHKTLQNAVTELSEENDIKKYDFSLLNQVLNKYELKSNFD